MYVTKTLLTPVLLLLLAGTLFAQDGGKIRIEKKDDLPRHTYSIEMSAVELLQDEEALKKLGDEIAADIYADLETYEIADDNTLQGFYSLLGSVAIMNGDWDKYLEYLELRKELETKDANKYTMGLVGRAAAAAYSADYENFDTVWKDALREMVEEMPYEVVAANLKSLKGQTEILSQNLVLGQFESAIQPILDKTEGEASQDLASSFVGAYFTYYIFIPNKDKVHEVLAAYIAENDVEKEDIWADREVALPENADGEPAVIAVWDSGVDTDIDALKPVLWTNEDEIPGNGVDDDNNGYVDDVHGIAYDLHSNKETELLFPIGDISNRDELQVKMKGLIDIQSSVDSKEASALKEELSTLEKEEVKPFIEEIGLYGNYCHGTHVAGIALKDNPFADLLVARITFDYHMIPEKPTVEQAEKDAEALVEAIEYFKANGVRAVNMSWGGSLRSIENALEAHNAGGTPEERKELARKIYDIGDVAFRKAIQDAPDILFITSAGNSDNDVKFDEFYPSSYDYPNIMSVGAVDQAGDETSFTSLGKVDIYANGFEVMSYVPGGDQIKLNGTSMASPQVLNLAGKILALNPDISTEELRTIILEGADDKQLGERTIKLMNPKQTIALLKDAE